ncbi:MAG: hypothetical protein AB1898_33485 [Acidobacteriota bacterium]
MILLRKVRLSAAVPVELVVTDWLNRLPDDAAAAPVGLAAPD